MKTNPFHCKRFCKFFDENINNNVYATRESFQFLPFIVCVCSDTFRKVHHIERLSGWKVDFSCSFSIVCLFFRRHSTNLDVWCELVMRTAANFLDVPFLVFCSRGNVMFSYSNCWCYGCSIVVNWFNWITHQIILNIFFCAFYMVNIQWIASIKVKRTMKCLPS